MIPREYNLWRIFAYINIFIIINLLLVLPLFLPLPLPHLGKKLGYKFISYPVDIHLNIINKKQLKDRVGSRKKGEIVRHMDSTRHVQEAE